MRVNAVSCVPATTDCVVSDSKGNAVYAIQMSWPAQPEAFIGAMGTIALGGRKVASISLLGADQKPQFRQQPEGLRIKLPAQAPCKYAYAFRIQF